MMDNPIVFEDDNPERTGADFAQVRPGAEALPPALVATLVKNKVGRPRGSGKKEQVSLRVDQDVLARLRATGPGWQTRLNDVLRRIAP